jgi:hypothetical protein
MTSLKSIFYHNTLDSSKFFKSDYKGKKEIARYKEKGLWLKPIDFFHDATSQRHWFSSKLDSGQSSDAMLGREKSETCAEKRNKFFTHCFINIHKLVHLADQLVDVLFTVTKVTALDKVVELAGFESTVRGVELERPEEVGGLLEVRADGEDLVDQVFHTDDAVLAKSFFDDLVIAERDALAVDLSVTALVDELTDRLQVWSTIGDVWLDAAEHVQGSLVELNKDTVVDLQQAEKLEDLSWLRSDLVDTLDTDNESKLAFSWNIVVVASTGQALGLDLGTFELAVLVDVLLSSLEDDSTLGLVLLQMNNKFMCIESKRWCDFSPERWLTCNFIAHG